MFDESAPAQPIFRSTDCREFTKLGNIKLIAHSCIAALFASLAHGQSVSIETVAVGDIGNAADLRGYGSVSYQYSIGKYEVTNAQYATFLNAKAAGSDPHGLYNPDMAGALGGITRTGSAGSYTYSTVIGRDNWAVNYVSFWDAARFTNWLENGQGSGDTEDGTYTLSASGITSNTVTRNLGATWAISSENEWQKAAYYKGGGLNSGYWRLPTQSDSVTTAMANYDNSIGTITPVGSYPFASAYGAFDMGGNVYEWNEAIFLFGSGRNVKGGSFNSLSSSLEIYYLRVFEDPMMERDLIGFRVSQIPAPSSIALLSIFGLGAFARRRD